MTFRPAPPVVFDGPSLAAALATEAAWLWWRDDPGLPGAADALAELQSAAAAARDGQQPILVAGVVRDRRGEVVGPLFRPVYQSNDDLVDCVARRLLPITAVETANVLVQRRAFERHGRPLPRLGHHAGMEWSARVLRGEVGWLATASALELPQVASARPLSRSERLSRLGATARTARTGVWSRRQTTVALARAVRELR